MNLSHDFKWVSCLINSILAKYLMRNAWVLIGTVFSIIAFVVFGNRVALMIKKSMQHGIPTADLLPLISFDMVRDIPLILSLSLFLAVILTINKFYKSSEAIVMNSLGLGDKHFMMFIQPVILPIAIFVLLLTTFVIPYTKAQKNIIMQKNDKVTEFAFVKPKEFQEFKDGEIIFYASKAQDGGKNQKMQGIFIYTLSGDEAIITLAEQAQKYTNPKTQGTHLRLYNGVRYHGFLGESNKKVLNFDVYDLQIINGETFDNTNFAKSESQNMIDLFYSNDPKNIAELQWRLSQPLSIVILSFLGVLLGKTSHRSKKNLGVLFGVGIFIIYNNALLIARSSLENGKTSIFDSMWGVHLALIIFILALYAYRHEKLTIVANKLLKR